MVMRVVHLLVLAVWLRSGNAVDVDVTAFTDTSAVPAAFRGGVAVTVSFSVTLQSDTDIVTGSGNVDLKYCTSGVDVRTVGDANKGFCTPAALTTTIATNSAFTAGVGVSGTGSVSINVATGDCAATLFLCVNNVYGGVDTVEPNNWRCIDISRRISCDTALTITNFGGIRSPLVRGRAYAGQSISLILTNSGTAGQGGDITAVATPYSNFVFKIYYSSVTGSLTQVGAVMTPTFAAADLRQGLAGGSANPLSLIGTVDVDAISDADCVSVKDICIEVDADTVNGASFLLAAPVSQCVTPDITCWPDPSLGTIGITAGHPFTGGSTISYTFTLNIDESNNGDNDEIYATTPADTNFNVKVFFSDADIGSGGTDTLGLTRYDVTPPGDQYSSALPKGATLSITGATASVPITDDDCPNVDWLCFVLEQGSSNEYIDASGINDPQNIANYKCSGVSLAKRCRADVSMVSLSETSVLPVVWRADATVTYPFSFTITTQHDVPTAGANKNFEITIGLAKEDIAVTGGATLATATAVATTINEASALAAGAFLSGTGSASITMPASGTGTTNCEKVLYVCLNTAPNSGYTEVDPTNNWACDDVRDRVVCTVDITPGLTSTPPAMIVGADVAGESLDLTLENTGTLGHGGDIHAVSGSANNFKISMHYSSVTASLTKVGNPFYPTFSITETQQGILGGVTSTLTGGSVDYPAIAAGDCQNVAGVCLLVEADAVNGASFSLPNTPVEDCAAIIVTCYPDPEPRDLTITAGGPIISGTSTTLTISMNVVNANGGDNDEISDATGSDTNYRLAFELSDVDLSTGAVSSLGLGQTAPKDFTNTGTELTVGLAASATASWSGVEADIVLSDAICPDVTHLCAILYRGSTRAYEDATAVADSIDLSPNTTCRLLAAAEKVCRADVDMVKIEDVKKPGTVFRDGVATSFSFKLTLRSNINIDPITAGADTNFDITYRFADRDLRATKGIDGINHIAAALTTTITPQGGLAANTDMVVTGTQSIAVPPTTPATNCEDVLFFCANTAASGGHTDSDTSNNWNCLDIAARISCDTALAITNFDGIRSPLVRGRAYAGQSISLTLTNSGTAGQGGDITAAASPYSNFAFKVYYSSSVGSLTPVGAAMTPTFAAADLRQGLAGGFATSFTGTVDMDAISDADCASIKDICIEVDADKVNGASFLLAAAGVQCVTHDISCWPDPGPSGFAPAGATTFTGGQTTAVTFNFNIVENSGGNNDEIYTPSGLETNFDAKLFFSDVDVSTGQVDTLGLVRYDVAPPGPEYVTALTTGTTIPVTAATASVLLTDADCPNVNFLCLELEQGSSNEYIDASSINDPQNINNYDCVGVTATKTCRADVDVTAFAETSTYPAIWRENAATTFAFEFTLQSDTDIEASIGVEKNFGMTYQLADKDLRLSGGTDTLGLGSTSLPTTLNEQASLTALTDLSATGTVSINFPSEASTNCEKVLYICINSAPTANAYAESQTSNNWRCIDIRKTVVCLVDLVPSALTGAPDSTDPINAGEVKNYGIGVTITNSAAASKQGSDISAVSGSRLNYAFRVKYSTADPIAAVGTAANAVFNILDLQQGLAGGGGTATLTGTVDLPAISAADCQSITHLCIEADADVANGAAFDLLVPVKSTCAVMEVYCYPDPYPDTLLFNAGQTTPIVSGVTSAIKVDLAVKNKNIGDNDVIPPAPAAAADVNFNLRLLFSDVDLSTGALDTLNLGYVSPNSYPAGVQKGTLAKGPAASNAWTLVDASMVLPDDVCADVNFLCAILMKGSISTWQDASTVADSLDLTPNTTCLDIAADKQCRTDVDMVDLTETTDPVAFRGDGTTTSNFVYSLTLNAIADIAAATTAGDKNFELKFLYTDADIRASGTAANTLSTTGAALTSQSFSDQVALAANTDLIGTGTEPLTLPAAICTTATHFCIYTEATNTFTDLIETNNYQCLDISARISCDVALAVTAATGVPDLTSPLAGPTGLTGAPLSLTIQNTATAAGHGSDINAVASPYSNYIFTAQYYASGTASGSVFSPDFAAADLRRGLAGGSASLTFTGTIDYPALSSSDCSLVTDVKFTVAADDGNGASFVLGTAATTLDKAIEITCYPDPTPTNLRITGGGPLVAATTTTLTLSVDVDNPSTGANDVIVAATGADSNFILSLQLTNADLSAGSVDTLGLSPVIPTMAGTELFDAIGASLSGNTWAGITADLFMDESLCPFVQYLCAVLKHGTSQHYTDKSAQADPINLDHNTTCYTLLATDKTCHEDVSIEAFTDTGRTCLVPETPAAAITMPFSMTIKNNDPDTDIAAVASPNENFHLSFQLSDVDLSVAAAASNSFNGNTATKFEDADVTLNPAGIPETSLVAGETLTFTGTVDVTIPAAPDCAKCLFLCANTMPSGAAYVETTTKLGNNWYCMDITKIVFCEVDMSITGFSTLPTASDPMLALNGRSGISLSVDVRNIATAGQGNAVHAVDSPSSNFLLEATYSQTSATITAVGSTFTPTMTAPDLRLGLAPITSKTLTGTIDLPALSTTDCPDANFVCLTISEDRVNDASWKETAAKQGNNFFCKALVRTCYPDVEPASFSITAVQPFEAGVSTTITFDINVAETNGDDVLAAANPAINFDFELQFSDSDLSVSGNVDTLGLSRVTPSFPNAAHARQAVAGSGTATLSGGKATMLLPEAVCESATHLCAILWPGRDATYLDLSAQNFPNDLSHNITCITPAKTCTVDLDVTGISISFPTQIVAGVATSVTADVTLHNTALATDIGAATLTSENFQLSMVFTDVDLRAGNSNGLSITAQTVAATSYSKAGLAAGQSFTFGATSPAAFTIPAADCSDVKYFCVTSAISGANAGYTEASGTPATLNNNFCVDITSILFCGVDLELGSVEFSPALIVADQGLNSHTFQLNVKNAGTGGQGYDIAAVTGSNYNFAVQAQYSDNDWRTTPDTLSLSPFYPTMQITNLQQAMAGVGTATTYHQFVGVADFPALDAASCNSVAFVCYSINEGVGASYKEGGTGIKDNNDWCEDVSIICNPDPKPQTLTTPTTFTSGTTDATFTLVVENAAGGTNDNIDAETGSVTNFRVLLQPSDVDMSVSGDNLRISPVNTVIPGGLLSSAIAAGGSITMGPGNTGTASVYIPQDQCSLVTNLCAILYRGTTNNYLDATTKADPFNLMPNITCAAVTPDCKIDVDMSTLTFSSVHIPKDVATTIAFSLTLDNTDLVTDIPALATGGADDNFEILFRLTDSDIRASGETSNTLGIADITAVNYNSAGITKAGLLASNDITIDGTIDVTVTTAQCPNVDFLCANSAPTAGGYEEFDHKNNWHCADIRRQISCAEDVELVSWSDIPTASQPLIGNTGGTYSFSAQIKNKATATPLDDIPAVSSPNSNFLVTGFYASDAAGTLVGSEVPVTGIPAADLRQGLPAVGTATTYVTLSGSLSMPITTGAQCNSVTHACAKVIEDSTRGASYTEATATLPDNTNCQALEITCEPDPAPENVATSSNFISEQTNSISFTFDIKNQNGAANDIIYTASAPNNNYDFQVQLSDVNMAAGVDTLGLAPETPVISAASRRVALAASATISFTGTASMFVTDADCANVQFFCVLYTPSAGVYYQDHSLVVDPTDTASNTACLDVSAQVVCGEDVEIFSFDEPANAVLQGGTATTISFSLGLRNLVTARDIAPVTGAEKNFEILLRLTDVDIRTAGEGSDTLAINADITPTLTPTTSDQQGLLKSTTVTISGSASVTIPTADCPNVNFICAKSMPTAGAYTEATNTRANNWLCKDIRAQIICGIDVQVTSWTVVHAAGNPLSGSVGATESLSIVLNNAGTAGVDDIPAATGTDTNYVVTAYYSSADVPATAKVGASITTTIPTAELQQDLAGGGTINLDGTITYPPLTDADCPNAAFSCMKVLEDTANGARYLEAAGTKADNEKCYAITVVCYPDPVPENLATTDTMTSGQTNSITFDFDVRNNRPAGSGDDIPAAISPATNWDLKLQLSDVDMASTDDTLGLGLITTTVADADKRAAIAVNSAISVTGATADVFLPDANCGNIKFLCALLVSGTDQPYEDRTATTSPSDFKANTTCMDITTLTECLIDVEMTDLREPANKAIYIDTATSLSFDLDVRNNDPSSDIPAVTGGEENFGLTFYLSDVDISITGPGSNSISTIPAANTQPIAVVPATDTQIGLLAGQTETISGTVGVTIPNDAATCAKVRFLCANTEPTANAYLEAPTLTVNNYACKDIKNQVSCGIDVQVTTFTTVPSATDPLIGPFGADHSFQIDFTNAATAGAGNNIASVSGSDLNYRVEGYYASSVDADSPTHGDVVGSYTISTTIAAADLQQGLDGGASMSLSGTVSYPAISTGDCSSVTHACMIVWPDSANNAIWAEVATIGDNFACEAIALTCAPDPEVTGLTTTSTFTSGLSNSITFDLTINNANGGTLDKIFAESYPNTNYEVRLQLSDVDMTASTDGLALAYVTPDIPIADLRGALDRSGSISISGATADILVPDTACSQVQYLCALLYPGINAKYWDASAANDQLDFTPNITCLDITTLLFCDIDLEVVSIDEPANAPLAAGTATTLSIDMVIQNLETDRDIPVAPGGEENYHLKFQLSDVDIRSNGETSNSVTAAAIENAPNVVVTPATDTGVALLRTQTDVLSVRVIVNVPAGECGKILFLCGNSLPSAGAYDEDQQKLANNWACKDISAQVQCAADVEIDSWTVVPDATDPMIGVEGRSGVTLTAEVFNQATVDPSNDIPSVSSPNLNYLFTMYYASGTATAPTKVGVNFPGEPVISDIQLRQALPAVGPTGAKTTFTGTFDYPAVTMTDCPLITLACLEVEPNTLHGAVYAEGGTTMPNINCQDLALSCAPDPAPIQLTITSGDMLVDTLNAITFKLKIENQATAGTGNDIFPIAAPKENFLVGLIFSDVDMTTATNSLATTEVTTTVPLADLRQGVAAGENFTTGTSTADMFLDSALCPDIKFICARLYRGNGAVYTDWSTYNDPLDWASNITCRNILSKKSCDPDPTITRFVLTTTTKTPLVYVQDEWQVVNWEMDIENIASGSASDIAAATAPTLNYDIYFYFTDTDIGQSPGTVNSTMFLYTISTGSLQASLPAGGTRNLAGTVTVQPEASVCNNLRFACTYFKHGPYNDVEHRNNHLCIDITGQITCKPDVNVVSFTANPTSQTFLDSATQTFTYNIAINNIAGVFIGNSILDPPTNPAASHNYKFKIQFTDVDLRAGGTDTIGLSPFVVTPQRDDTLAASGATVTYTSEGVGMILPAPGGTPDECTAIRYACITVEKGDNAQYVDVDLTNNVMCIDVFTSMKNCRPVIHNLPAITYVVPENLTIGSSMTIFTVDATQGDNNIPTQLQITKLGSLDGGDPRFSVDVSSGDVTVTVITEFDYEIQSEYKIPIKVTDTTSPAAYSSTGTLTLSILDSNDQPIITNLPDTLSPVDENSVGPLFTVEVSDEDRPAQNFDWRVEYNPTTPAGLFNIDNAGIISVAAPGMDYEGIAPPTYSLTVYATDNGLPAQTAIPKVLIVPIDDVPEPLSITNMPAERTFSEDFVNGVDKDIFTVEAYDPDSPTTFEYYMSVTPIDGNFKLKAGDNSVIQLVASPSLDHERAPEYKIAIMVKDGTGVGAAIGELIVKITNSTKGEVPVIDQTHWPASITLNEDTVNRAKIYTVLASDEDKRELVYSFADIQPISGYGKFEVNSKTGEVYVAAHPDFNFESVPQYTLTMQVCASNNCTTKDLLIDLHDNNEKPFWTPQFLQVNTLEGRFPGISPVATDPDGNTLTYTKITTTTKANRFSIDPITGVISARGLDYESDPHTLYVTFLATDPRGLSGYFYLEVNILNRNDHTPTLDPNDFSVAFKENTAPNTTLELVTITDRDLAPYGMSTAFVDPLDGNQAYNHLFMYERRDKEDLWELRVQSPWDIETMPTNPVVLTVYAVDLDGRTGTGTVTATVINVNDNRPVFVPDFYSWEVLYNTTVGTQVGTVTATDADVLYNETSYEIFEGGESFNIGPGSGKVFTDVNPLIQHHKYLLYAVAKDNDPDFQDVSTVTTIRIDTYTDWEVLTNWTTCLPPAHFDIPGNRIAFTTEVSKLCTPCRAHIHAIHTDGNGNAVVILYFLKNTITDSVEHVGDKKEFYTASEIVYSFTTDNVFNPGNSVTGSVALAPSCIRRIERYKPDPRVFNWFLDSIEGNMFIGACMSMAFAAAMTATICLFKQLGTTAANAVKDGALPSVSSWGGAGANPKPNPITRAPPRSITPPYRPQPTTPPRRAPATPPTRSTTPPRRTPPRRSTPAESYYSRPDSTASVSNVSVDLNNRRTPDDLPFKKYDGRVPLDYREEANYSKIKNVYTAPAWD